MKTKIKSVVIVMFAMLTFFNCDNDDAVTPATNEDACDFEGFSYLDNNNDDQILIAESDLSTQFFPNASNGPYGAPGFEISGTSLFFTTNVITLGATGPGRMTLNSGLEQMVTVTCQREGTAVGDELRLDVVIGTIEVEFCVVIDEVL